MADVKNVRLTTLANQATDFLIGHLGVSERLDVIRLGFAFAVNSGVVPERADSSKRRGSNYDVGGIDPDGLMAEVIRIYYPDQTAEPYRTVEALMSQGLCLLQSKIKNGDLHGITDILDGGGVGNAHEPEDTEHDE